MINTKTIKLMNPCADRFNNWLEHYYEFEGSVNQFLNLTKINHSDKLWVTFRYLPKNATVECAARFAESVLHIYEAKYPNDDRPRKAIEATRSGNVTADANAANAAAYAARAAAYAADATEAADAAYAAARAFRSAVGYKRLIPRLLVALHQTNIRQYLSEYLNRQKVIESN